MNLNCCTIKKNECALLHSSCKLCRVEAASEYLTLFCTGQIVLEVVVKNLYWDQMYWLEYKPLGFACVLLPCCTSVENEDKKMAVFPAIFPPGYSVSSSIDPFLLLLVDVASLLSHAWWYKMFFLSQLSLCSNFGSQILVRQDRCRGDQGLVMFGRWGENKSIVVLYILLYSMPCIIELWQLL